jgi:DNA uptake protein ComE-like DNA-binding protein
MFAWGYHTHRKIAAEAFEAMPQEFRLRFASQKKSFLKGSTDPDILIKDFTNHIYHPNDSQKGAYFRIKSLYEKTVELIRNNESDEKIAYVSGLMSHYIADINQPLHTAGRRRDPNEGDYHSRFEKDVNRHLKNLSVPAFEFLKLRSIQDRVKEMANEAHIYYDQIGQAYRSGGELPVIRELTEQQIYRSIKHVADFWRSACLDAGYNFAAGSPFDSANSWQLSQEEEKNNATSININSASQQQLVEFFKISPSKAGQIIDGRPYRRAYDLAKSRIFNPMYIKRNKEKIRVK